MPASANLSSRNRRENSSQGERARDLVRNEIDRPYLGLFE